MSAQSVQLAARPGAWRCHVRPSDECRRRMGSSSRRKPLCRHGGQGMQGGTALIATSGRQYEVQKPQECQSDDDECFGTVRRRCKSLPHAASHI